PNYPYNVAGRFGHGILAVDGVLYTLVSQVDGTGWNQYYAMELLTSTDNGATWYRVRADGTEQLLTGNDAAAITRNQADYFFHRGTGKTVNDGATTKTYYPFVYCTFL